MIPSCAICQRESKSWGSLAKHTAQAHKISAENYFIQHIGSKPICKYCGNDDMKFLSMAEGYSDYCVGCTKLHGQNAAKLRREKLKNDPVAYEQFIGRLSSSVSTVWANRSSEEKQSILLRFRNTGKPPSSKKIMSAAEEELYMERTTKALAKQLKLDVNYSKPVAEQVQMIVDKNLEQLFGF
jgi:hypothetical protein